jgi:hypothetical protein
MGEYFDFLDVPEFLQSCLVFDFYSKKVAAYRDKWFGRETVTSHLTNALNSFLIGDEQTYFKNQLEKCKDNYEKSLCYLVRGMAAALTYTNPPLKQ